MKQGKLILFSGRPAAGKTTIALELISLMRRHQGISVHFIEADQWRVMKYKNHAFDADFVNKMVVDLNKEIKPHVLNGKIVILESGNTTAAPATRAILIRGIKSVYDIRIDCGFTTAFMRDVKRSWNNQEPRMKYLYIQTAFRNLFQQNKIYLAGFNKPLFRISGLYVEAGNHSAVESARQILHYIIYKHIPIL